MTEYLLDTCAVLWLANGDNVSEAASAALDESHQNGTSIFVSPFSAWEIGNLVSLNRIRLSQSPDRWFENFMQNGGVHETSLSSEILIASSFLPEIRHKDPADRIIIATARAEGLTIITRDQKILDYAEQGHVNALRC